MGSDAYKVYVPGYGYFEIEASSVKEAKQKAVKVIANRFTNENKFTRNDRRIMFKTCNVVKVGKEKE